MNINESEKEKNLLEQIDKYLENELSGNSGVGPVEPEIPTVDENGLADKDTTITTDDPNIQIVIPKGFAPVILQTDRTDSMPGENGAVKEIMPIEEWNNITAEQINKGIVVVDNAITYDGGQATGAVSDFNEYVWIPMPDSSKFARVAWTTPYGYDENGNFGSGGKVHLLAETSTLNRFWEDKTTEEYINMTNSVNRNKGFYISRYEASDNGKGIAQSKRNQQVWKNMLPATAVSASSNMKANINSHLIYGIEWDSVLQWLLDSGAIISSSTSGQNKIIDENDVQTNSSSWGNYSNSTGNASVNAKILQISGKSEYWKVNNIYDLAGNLHEVTKEKYSTITDYDVRGGVYVDAGTYSPVADRNVSNNEANGYVRI